MSSRYVPATDRIGSTRLYDRSIARTMREEMARVLRPGGRLHIADWGRPATPLLRASFFVRASGFSDVRVHARRRTLWGTLELIEGRRR